jgi:hypothetical protein
LVEVDVRRDQIGARISGKQAAKLIVEAQSLDIVAAAVAFFRS